MESVAVTIPSLRIGYISIDKIITIMIKNFVSIDSILLFLITLELNNKKVKANTRDIFAILDPRAFPIAILPFPSKVDMIDINISGADVAIPIKIKLEMKCDILNFLEIFSVVVTRRFAP